MFDKLKLITLASVLVLMTASMAEAQVDPDDQYWHDLSGGMNHWVSSLTVYDGELVAGGFFTTAGGAPANHIARWDGSAWQPE